MDALLTSEDRAFREEVRAFLAEKLTPELARAARRSTSVFHHPDVSQPWQKILHEKGWVAPDWPVQFGGTGWSDMQRYIFARECALANAPSLAPQGLKMVAPVIMHYGTPEQQAYYLPRILSGEDYWCQGFSEPGAGSDLASLKLRADSDGDHYVLNGSKIWTTHAQFANRMFALVRTSSEGKPQAGITFLLLDMDTPGLTVKPIYTIPGDHDFNQVFFDNVRVPKANRLGEENDGWSVAKYLLTFERGGKYSPGLTAHLSMLKKAAARTGWDQLPGNAERIAAEEIGIQALMAMEMKSMREPSQGPAAATRASMLKILGTEASQRLDLLALDIAGGEAGLETEDGLEDLLATALPRYLNNRASSIYAGSNEIQRDILAKAIIDMR
ncbi:acyl-CoA dehydrogenase family protein [Sandaracinobacteroides sp. A072]|uniref:acyl-CoA dehydrogenase family protein n=1 Tax=Sandaracinobacteroides sp. A072 TaxID=3461146 RepID=UPI004041C614